MKLEDIARLAGVSKATVSSVLNGKSEKYRISAVTQARIRGIALEHAYQPNYSAAALRRGTTRSIGFVMPDFENRSYLRIAKRLEALARRAGYQLVIASSDDDVDTEMQAVNMLVSRGVDALVLASCTQDENGIYRTLMDKGTPIIALDRPLSNAFCSVLSDDRQGAFELVQSMELGDHSSKQPTAVLLGAKQDMRISRLREQGFLDGLAQVPGAKGHCVYGERFDVESGRQALQQTLEQLGGLPDVLMTTSFSLLEGVLKSLREDMQVAWKQSTSPPRLATFGDSRLLDLLPFPVNSMTQQYELIAESAWTLAKKAIENSYSAEQVVLKRVLKDRRKDWAAAE